MLVGVNGSGNAFVSGQTSGKPLILETNNTERMRIDSSGIDVTGTTTTTNLTIDDGVIEFDKPSVFGFRFLQNDAGNDLSIQQGDANNANYVTRLNIGSNGNVGIGTTAINPNAKLHVQDSDGSYPDDANTHFVVESASHSYIGLGGGTSSDVGIHMGDSGGINRGKLAYLNASDSMVLFTSSLERMRLDASGNLLINQTSSNLTYGKLQVSAGGETAGFGGIVGFFDTDSSVASSNLILRLMFSADTDATSGVFIRFSDSNSTLGQITAANGTQVSYGVSSDERLKENIVDASSQLDLINNIQVREFDWKVNGYHEVGMIAQELNTVVPSVVQEGGDDITEQPWSVDYGKLTPYLIKAIQEQQTIIDDLKSRIETLEG
jgi:hypothetical protein